MSKRTRGSRAARNRPATRPAPVPQRIGRPDETEDAALPAGELEPAVEREAQASRAERPLPRARVDRAAATRSTGRSGGVLAAKAADEYVYVSRDLNRIARFASGIVAVMVVLWLLIDVTKIVSY
jgi:hypothetical protein